MAFLSLIFQLSLFVAVAFGYGFQYNYDPSTQYSSYWKHVPGSAGPITIWDANTGDLNWASGRAGRTWNAGSWTPESRVNWDTSKDSWNRGNWGRANTWNQANYGRDTWNRATNWNQPNSWNRGDPNLNRYWDATAQEYRWTCKTDAIYSTTDKQCIWDPKVTAFNRFA